MARPYPSLLCAPQFHARSYGRAPDLSNIDRNPKGVLKCASACQANNQSSGSKRSGTPSSKNLAGVDPPPTTCLLQKTASTTELVSSLIALLDSHETCPEKAYSSRQKSEMRRVRDLLSEYINKDSYPGLARESFCNDVEPAVLDAQPALMCKCCRGRLTPAPGPTVVSKFLSQARLALQALTSKPYESGKAAMAATGLVDVVLRQQPFCEAHDDNSGVDHQKPPTWVVDYENHPILRHNFAHAAVLCTPAFLIGVNITAPFTLYPSHRHLAHEMYFPLGYADWYQERRSVEELPEKPVEAWRALPPVATDLGQVVIHDSNEAHGLRTGPTPLLNLWIQYGDLSGPTTLESHDSMEIST